ncbi:hypothetical protein [Endothiovibrio diazotrophicus]
MNVLRATLLSLPLLLATTVSQAVGLRFTFHDAEGNPATSDIAATFEIGGIYFVRITGGMPTFNSSEEVYIDPSFFDSSTGQPDSVLGYALYCEPYLYLFVDSTVETHGIEYPTQNLFLFRFNSGSELELTHLYRANDFFDGLFTYPEPVVYEMIDH